MKKLTMEKKIFISILLIISILNIVLWLINPLMRPAWLIRVHMFILTPKGTSMEDVIEVVNNNENWIIRNISDEVGYLNQAGRIRFRVGQQSIRVYHGDYFLTSVTVFYGFDEKGKLIDIWVWKDHGP